jgi:hypothetical protein
MEFLTANLINTTTQIAVSANTSVASNLFNRDPLYQYYTENYADDSLTASITITFDATTSVSRISLKDTNLKEFTMFYNGATSNSFALTNSTATSSWNSNAETDLYLKFPTTLCTSITIDMKKTITANQEKRIGLLTIADLYLELTQIPSANNYKPKIVPKQVVHKLSDGGTRIHNVKKKWTTSVSLDFVSKTIRDSLEDLYDLQDPFNFCPFGTASSWDALLFEAVWDGPFNFYEYSDNASSSGFSGDITMKETPI